MVAVSWKTHGPIVGSLGLAGDGDDTALIMSVERAFDIRLADDEVSRLRTVGELHDLVVSKLPRPMGSVCLAAHAFYRVRAGLGDGARRIGPRTAIDDLVRPVERRGLWRRLRESDGLDMPPLAVPRWLSTVILALWPLMALLGLLVPLFQGGWSNRCVLGAAVGGLLFPLLAFGMTKPLARELPVGTVDVGDLSRAVLALNFGRLARESGSWREDGVWRALAGVIGSEVSVVPERIGRRTRFI